MLLPKKKVKRFRAWKFVQDTVQDLGTSGAKEIANMLLVEGCNWVKKCEGKTKSQVHKLGFAWHDDWAVEE